MLDPLLAMLIVQVISFAILVYSVILHEIAHGFVADKLGDPTARLAGRLTLDPRPHIDLWMTIVLPLILFLSNAGVIFGAAKPVPIDPYNFRDPKKDTALTALAGPLTNILIAILFALLLRIALSLLPTGELMTMIQSLFLQAVVLNVSLAVFNLIPLPPLDGFKVLAGILSDDIADQMYRLERYGFMIIFAILLLFPNVIFGIISPIARTIIGLLVF